MQKTKTKKKPEKHPQIQHLNKTIRIWRKQTIQSSPRLHHQQGRRKVEIDQRQSNKREEMKNHTSCRPLLKTKVVETQECESESS